MFKNIIALAVILVVVSLVLNPVLGIFITCASACLLLDDMKNNKHNHFW